MPHLDRRETPYTTDENAAPGGHSEYVQMRELLLKHAWIPLGNSAGYEGFERNEKKIFLNLGEQPPGPGHWVHVMGLSKTHGYGLEELQRVLGLVR